MAFIRRKTLYINELKPGQIVEIEYKNDRNLIDRYLVLVLGIQSGSQPTIKKTTSNTSTLYLRGLKLVNLIDSELIRLITMINEMETIVEQSILFKFNSTPFLTGRGVHRTYKVEKISGIVEFTVI